MKVFAFCEFLKKESGASAKLYLNYLRQQNNTSTLPAQIINKFTFGSCLPILYSKTELNLGRGDGIKIENYLGRRGGFSH